MSELHAGDMPHWMREFERHLALKNLFLLHGNIYDLCSYPVRRGDTYHWGYFRLRELLCRFFLDRDYRAVAVYDPVDDLAFHPEGAEEFFGPGRAEGAGRTGGSDGGDAARRGRGAATRGFSGVLHSVRTALSRESAPLALVMDHASRLVTSPDRLSREERGQFVQLLKCVEEAAGAGGGRSMNHALVMLCDRLSDLPSWLYMDHPLVKTISVDLPDERERRRFFRMAAPGFFCAGEGEEDDHVDLTTATDLTRGLSNYELECLRLISLQEEIPLSDPRSLVETYKFGVMESAWDRLLEPEGREKLARAEEILARRVKGQEPAIHAVVDIIKRAAGGLSGIHHSASGQKPRGVLFFAGPTGVGKTELARALAELLFGDDEACIRFDMSEYAQEHSDQRLFGAPPGYVGHEQGGQLTNQVRESPFSVLLFDEIEKAHPRLMDKFLQILEDGRLTDGKGETVHFSEAVIIFTSNIGAYVDVPAGDGGYVRRPNILPHYWYCRGCGAEHMREEEPASCSCGSDDLQLHETPYRTVKERVLRAVRDHFRQELGRPEIYNRIGNNFVVLDYIRRPIMREILHKILENVHDEVRKRRGLQVQFAQSVYEFLLDEAGQNPLDGGRGIGNLVETALVNPLARLVFDRAVEDASITVHAISERRVGEEVVYELDASVER